MTSREALVEVSGKLADLEESVSRCLTDQSMIDPATVWYLLELKNRLGLEHKLIIRRLTRK